MPDAPAEKPDSLLQLATAYRGSAVFAAAAAHQVFTHLQRGAGTAAELAAAAGISARGAQVVLDGLLGLGLIALSDGRYANAPAAAAFLLEGAPGSLAGMAQLPQVMMPTWAKLAEAVKTGAPVTAQTTEAPDLAFWRLLVPAIAPLSYPAAKATIAALEVATLGPISILDVGGGSGAFSHQLLLANPRATATQLDWPTVNAIARELAARAGVADRFRAVDGDFHTADWGTAAHDLGVFSNIAHQESPEQNVEACRRFRAALKPAGTLVISDFVLEDDRSGPPQALVFHSEMLLNSPKGAAWRKADYREWLASAGFQSVRFETTPGPSTLIFAR